MIRFLLEDVSHQGFDQPAPVLPSPQKLKVGEAKDALARQLAKARAWQGPQMGVSYMSKTKHEWGLTRSQGRNQSAFFVMVRKMQKASDGWPSILVAEPRLGDQLPLKVISSDATRLSCGASDGAQT
ncbi:hypothetical protein GCM10007276_16550 [Agaricicola taiwanensis]|uniref:Uncharacterized protein n=1 Tax=Agaricicola taiwanensis TaxID=591372 RepID=A0A8J2VWJ1_9RHOB|nr:hypothetical protein GCM10007276_16550 [Agaricicola taiwanensis]